MVGAGRKAGVQGQSVLAAQYQKGIAQKIQQAQGLHTFTSRTREVMSGQEQD